MSEVVTGSGRWISYHIFLPAHVESFLAGHLPAWLQSELRAGRIKRFFFIRYSEGGPHLRLRVKTGESPADIRTSLEACVRAYVRDVGTGHTCRLEEHRYDRTELYFGETCASVYSELLNEATSRLALRLLRTPGMEYRAQRWLVTVSTVHVLLHRVARNTTELLALMAESREFARHAVRASGLIVPDATRGASGLLDAPVLKAVHRMTTVLESDPSSERIVQLFRRTRRQTRAERFAATHGLHLLCNKLGFSLRDEYALFESLGRAAAEPGDVSRVPTL